MSTQKLKTTAEIEAMRQGGKILAQIFEDLKPRVKAGVSEKELDAWVDSEIKARGATATYKTDEVSFPAAICISTNEQIVHSVPSDYVLQDGDVVSFDLVITYKGMKTDSAFTMIVGDKPNGVKSIFFRQPNKACMRELTLLRGRFALAILALRSRKY